MKFILYIIIICFLIPEAKCQNFSKNYYINDDIDAGFNLYITKSNYFIHFAGYYGTPSYVINGFLKTNLLGELQQKIVFDSLYTDQTSIFEDGKILYSGVINHGAKYGKQINLLSMDENGNFLMGNQLDFKFGRHLPRNLGKINNKYFLFDHIYYSGDNFQTKTWFFDTLQIHIFDSFLKYKKSINCDFYQPLSLRISATIHDDNYLVTAISYQDTAKSAGGRTRYVSIGFDSLGQQKWIYKNPKNLVDQFQKESIETVAFSDKSTVVLMPYISDLGGFPKQQIVRLNTKGKKIWSYDDIYDDIYEYYEYISIFKTKDDGIVAVGQNYNQPKDGLPPSGRCGIITRIDKNGSLLWRRKVWDVNVPFNHCGFNSGTELEDGSLLITGWWRDTLPDPYYDTNVWLIKLDSNGCYNPGCVGNDSVTTTQNIIVIGREMIKLSPNPANDYLKVSWNKTPTPAKSLVVYDLSGKAILQSLISDKSGSTELSISELPSGLYVLKIFGDRWESAPEKFVKE